MPPSVHTTKCSCRQRRQVFVVFVSGKGTIKLKVPKETKGRCTLKICGNCVSPREDVFTFYNSTIIMVEEKGTSVFIQMDKPIYKPGQTGNCVVTIDILNMSMVVTRIYHIYLLTDTF